jgi:4-amino-4-deoxychorismate lyase
MNVAFVMADNVLRHPRFVRVLAGCTSLRLLELAPTLVTSGVLAGVDVDDIPVADARASREMILLGSSIKVAPIVEWDGQPIGSGKPGPVARALLELLEKDMRTGDRLIDVPY